jgi:DNA repair protein RecN (Recombination protein N)
MIKSLYIRNYALIQQLGIRPSARLNTITGETGAGKSIMLGAIGLLLGNRADSRSLFREDQKCVIEALFDVRAYELRALFEEAELDYADECILRREVSPGGKSRAFINDTPVNLDLLKRVGDHLVDVHSQRDTLLLGSPSYQLGIVDTYAANRDTLRRYQAQYQRYREQQKILAELARQAEEMKREADYHKFLYDELQQAALQAGEQESLEEELRIMEHAEEIRTRLSAACERLENSEQSAAEMLQQARRDLEQVSRFAAHFSPLHTRLEACTIELRDIAGELQRELDRIDFDETRQTLVQDRLSLLYRLLQKHQAAGLDELLQIQDRLGEQVGRVDSIDEELQAAAAGLAGLEEELRRIGQELRSSRVEAAGPLVEHLERLLRALEMPHASIRIQMEEQEPGPAGMDDLRILFSANVGVAPAELRNVASGGEFSRLMFAVKYVLAGSTALPTVIFDEIDSGISGEVAIRLVQMMEEMARRHQVIAITHLPQIAARGNAHFYVYKEQDNGQTASRIRLLDRAQREEEIARMIGGDRPSKAALESARELMAGSEQATEAEAGEF